MSLARKGLLSLLLPAFLVVAAPAAAAHTVVVSNSSACPGADATTIQDGVDMAAPGDTVRVCRGTYDGGVTIDKAGLKLKALGLPGSVVIQGPQTTSSGKTFGLDIVADRVTVGGFEIRGFGGVHDASGIFVGGLFAGDTAHRAGHADIEGNNIHDNGNGVYLWQSNDNEVAFNALHDNKDVDGDEGVGVSSYNGSGNAQTAAANAAGQSGLDNHIHHNVVYDNDRLGVFAGACSYPYCDGATPQVNADISGTEIDHNIAYGNGGGTTEAIGLLNAHGGEIDHNAVYRNDLLGVFVNYSDGATVGHNSVDGNSWYGILVGNSAGIAVSHNDTDGPKQLYGEYVYGTTGSSFDRNSAVKNSTTDLFWDGAGTNTFSNNKCGTAAPSKAAWDCH